MKRDIIEQLRKALRESDESQLAIAKAVEIDQGNLNRFINGERGISLETAARFCSHLKLELAQCARSRRLTQTDRRRDASCRNQLPQVFGSG